MLVLPFDYEETPLPRRKFLKKEKKYMKKKNRILRQIRLEPPGYGKQKAPIAKRGAFPQMRSSNLNNNKNNAENNFFFEIHQSKVGSTLKTGKQEMLV